MSSLNCPFCQLNNQQIIFQDELVISFRDGFPISPGHTLIIPKRHTPSFFELTELEHKSLLYALHIMKKKLDQDFTPDGYNIGINDGLAAGQTVMHLHVHLIPRYTGDCTDPRGGVRWIFPEKAVYWKS
jgi:diadenosine tetraphosphate (Ap4A) HIT family hydrolase